jgi:hypothetical protein
MSLVPSPSNPATLAERLHDALAVTPSLIADVIREACRRNPSQRQAGKTERVQELIRLDAWTDAALALIDLELPHWQIRRLVYDEGEWHCTLSRERELPDWLDESIEGHHPDLALAMLSAFVEAQRVGTNKSCSSVPRVPQGAHEFYEPLLSDNFG